MGTQSTINTLNKDGKYIGIKCFLDGFLDCNGAILLNKYTTQEKVDELMLLGNLYSLGTVINKKDIKDGDYACEISSAVTMPEDNFPYTATYIKSYREYNYLFKDGEWYWNSSELCIEDLIKITSNENIIVDNELWRKLTTEDIENSDYWEKKIDGDEDELEECDEEEEISILEDDEYKTFYMVQTLEEWNEIQKQGYLIYHTEDINRNIDTYKLLNNNCVLLEVKTDFEQLMMMLNSLTDDEVMQNSKIGLDRINKIKYVTDMKI